MTLWSQLHRNPSVLSSLCWSAARNARRGRKKEISPLKVAVKVSQTRRPVKIRLNLITASFWKSMLCNCKCYLLGDKTKTSQKSNSFIEVCDNWTILRLTCVFVSPPLTASLPLCKSHKLRIAPEACRAAGPLEQTRQQTITWEEWTHQMAVRSLDLSALQSALTF